MKNKNKIMMSLATNVAWCLRGSCDRYVSVVNSFRISFVFKELDAHLSIYLVVLPHPLARITGRMIARREKKGDE